MCEIISHLECSSFNDNATIRNYERFCYNINYRSQSWRIFKDATVFSEFENITRINGEFYHTTRYPSGIRWMLDDLYLYYSKSDDYEDNFVLSTLDYVLSNFFTEPMNGHVLKLDRETKSLEYFYNITNSSLKYHVNSTLDYSDHYRKCVEFYDGEENREFDNLILSIYQDFDDEIESLADIDDTPEEIFENTYKFIDI